MTFTREIDAAARRRGTFVVSWSTPSMRKRTRRSRRASALAGSKWMSDAPCSRALAMTWLTSLMTGASSADSRRSTTSAAASSSDSSSVSATTIVEPAEACHERGDVLAARDRRAHLEAGHDRDVVDASTLAGSAIATVTVWSSTKATGIAS